MIVPPTVVQPMPFAITTPRAITKARDPTKDLSDVLDFHILFLHPHTNEYSNLPHSSYHKILIHFRLMYATPIVPFRQCFEIAMLLLVILLMRVIY